MEKFILSDLIARLEKCAFIHDGGDPGLADLSAAYEDMPEVTWDELKEMSGLMREAAAALRAVAGGK